MHTNSPYNPEQIYRFIQFLYAQNGPSGRANLAELRRSAADPLNDYRSIWILGEKLPDTNGWPFDAYRLVAILFAIHKQKFSDKEMPAFNSKEKRRSLGASLRRLRGQLQAGQESLDKRFAALLNTPQEDLAVPLRGFIQRVANAEKPIALDYFQLLKDLLFWNSKDKNTQRQWARDYWQPIAASHQEDKQDTAQDQK